MWMVDEVDDMADWLYLKWGSGLESKVRDVIESVSASSCDVMLKLQIASIFLQRCTKGVKKIAKLTLKLF